MVSVSSMTVEAVVTMVESCNVVVVVRGVAKEETAGKAGGMAVNPWHTANTIAAVRNKRTRDEEDEEDEEEIDFLVVIVEIATIKRLVGGRRTGKDLVWGPKRRAREDCARRSVCVVVASQATKKRRKDPFVVVFVTNCKKSHAELRHGR